MRRMPMGRKKKQKKAQKEAELVYGDDWWGAEWTPQKSLAVVEDKKGGETWTCENSDVAGCPLIKKAEVFVPSRLWQAWIDMAGALKTEWLALLLGEVDIGRGRADVENMYFPPQVVASARCSKIEELTELKPNTIGMVHSHVNMNAFFSSTDDDHANWPVEIVVNAKGDYAANLRMKLACDQWERKKADVYLAQSGLAKYYTPILQKAIEVGTTHVKAKEEEEKKKQAAERKTNGKARHQAGFGGNSYFVPAAGGAVQQDTYSRSGVPAGVYELCRECKMWHYSSQVCDDNRIQRLCHACNQWHRPGELCRGRMWRG
jgi:hypothetical protein